MMTVRFPSGFSVQYNDAHFVTYGENHNILRTARDGKLIAVVPKGAIVEAVQPCRLYNAAQDKTVELMQAEMDLVRREIRSLKRKLGK